MNEHVYTYNIYIYTLIRSHMQYRHLCILVFVVLSSAEGVPSRTASHRKMNIADVYPISVHAVYLCKCTGMVTQCGLCPRKSLQFEKKLYQYVLNDHI